jgi:Zn finger protein HypA/HybF involved in hydrogenase expression
MALPMMNTPLYKIEIPSTNQQVTFRPFLVREEKALLLAQQSENLDVMLDTVREVIKSCIKETINVDSLAIFDVEYLFTQIRAKSVGELVSLTYVCGHCDNENNSVRVDIDLTKIPIIRDPAHTNKIHLFGEVGVIMKYPTINTLRIIKDELKDANAVIQVVVDCIDAVYSGDEMLYAAEHTKQELEDFVLNLTKQQFNLIEEFWKTAPVFTQIIDFNCPACGAKNKALLEGLESFF